MRKPLIAKSSACCAAVADRPVEHIPDDRLEIEPGDSILLIVEDDPHYARVIMDLARDQGFKVLVATRGADALDLAKQFQPTAVSLDVFLPDMLGWTVLSQLKQNPLTRHIPVQIITLDEDRQHALGARRLLVRHQADDHRGRRRGAGADQGIRLAAPQAAAGGRGQRSRADEHPRAARLRRHRDRHRRHRRGGAVDPARPAVRLRGARPAAAGHVRLRGAGADPRRRVAVGRSGRGVHRPRAVGRGGRPAAHHGAQHRGERRRVAGAAARRNVAVPAPRRHRPAAGEAAHARAAHQLRRGSGRPHRAAGRRRRAQHLRAEQRAGTPRHARAHRDHRHAKRSSCWNRRPISPSC